MDNSSNIPLDSLGDILENAPAFSGQEEATAPAPPSGDCFYRRIDGKETGPFTVSQLQALIDQGHLQRSDRVRRADSNFWLPCQEIAALVFRTLDRAQDTGIEAASSLLNELFSEAETPGIPSDLLSLEDLPDADDPSPPKDSAAIHELPLTALAKEVKPPKPSSPSLFALKKRVRHEALRAAPPESPVVVPDREASTPGAEVSRDTQTEMPLTPTQVAPPAALSQLVPSEKSKPKSNRKSKSSPRFSLPSIPLLLGLAGLILILAVVRFWPKSSGGIQGHITVDGTPLTVGSVSLTSAEGNSKAMSFSVVEGRFQSANGLPDGSYDAIVIVGSPLGMAVVQLENTPFKPLNGAHFKQKVTVKPGTPIQLELSASEAILMKSRGDADPLSSK